MKRIFYKDIFSNQRGQGITEYILLLIIILAMILGGMYQLNTAFERWANAYFGEYLSCLLETGELPSIGGAPGDSGICNEFFEEFSLANGRRLKGGEGAGGGEGGRGGEYTDGSVRESQQRREEGRSDGGRGGVRERVSGGSYVSSGGGRGSSGSFDANSQSQGSARGRRNEKARYTGSTDSSLPGDAGYSGGGSRRGRPQYIAIRGNRIVETEERERQTTGQTTSVRRDTSSQAPTNKIRVLRTEAKKDVRLEEEPMSFGNYLRFFIIAAIIIALVLLIGGQMLQVSKNSD